MATAYFSQPPQGYPTYRKCNVLICDSSLEAKESSADEESPLGDSKESVWTRCNVAKLKCNPNSLARARTRDESNGDRDAEKPHYRVWETPGPTFASCLRRSPSEAAPTKRRLVRGLWKTDSSSCLFAPLHNELIVEIMSFLDLKDLIVATRVCQRWEHCAQDKSLYESVDATEFVRHLYNKCENSKQTSELLSNCLEPHTATMKSLTIRSIEQALDPNVFLPTMHSSLCQLELTGWSNLRDVHVQVMFLSPSNKNSLIKLVLDDCPLLTNATIQSVARHCFNLQTLSICGCINVSCLDALQQSWRNTRQACKEVSNVSLESLFSPPSSREPMVTNKLNATLRDLNICGTGITAESLVKSLSSPQGKVILQRLVMDGDSWNDKLLKEFDNAVDGGLKCLQLRARTENE